MRHFSVALSVWLFVSGINMRTQAQPFTDPVPPKVEKLTDMPAPQPQKQPGLKYHTAPKPLAAGAIAQDWNRFLGPTTNGISAETPILQQFDKNGPTLLWEVPKGDGYASPAVIGNRVLLFHRMGEEEILECLHAETGKRFWRVAYPTAYSDRYGFSGGPRCQPVTDGENVYTLGVEGKLHCIQLTTGQILWKRDIVAEFKLKQNFFGVGATPLLEGDNLLVVIGAEDGPTVAAFDKKSGKMAWGAGKEWTPGYAAPIPATVHGKRRVFVFTGGESRPPTGGLLCIDPTTGKVDFSFPWRGRRYESVNASAPLIVGNQVFISECYGAGGALLDLLPDGGYKQVWSNEALNTHFMTAIHKDGYLYGIAGHGPRNAPLVCIELKTGKEMWRTEPDWEETIKTPQGERKANLSPGLASLILVEGRALMLSEYGHLVWIDLNPKAYKELERTRLFLSGENWSMPALSRGLLYVCQNSRGFVDETPQRLLCYDLRGAKK